jgi:PhzF family phenazine biosynthesis protein
MSSAQVASAIYWIDAFAEGSDLGNPAACVLASSAWPEAAMQRLAAELNLSETAFCWPEAGAFRLRGFTPKVEVKLCGHATLATASALWQAGQRGDELRFQTLSGLLLARKAGEAVELEFPAQAPQSLPPDKGLTQALGQAPLALFGYGQDLLAEFKAASAVRACAPDFAALARLPYRGVCVTAAADEAGVDFVSRFFGPGAGINEDPVTGSAHCGLAPFWAARLGKKLLQARQLSARGGRLECELSGDRVLLRGRTRLVLRGEVEAL